MKKLIASLLLLTQAAQAAGTFGVDNLVVRTQSKFGSSAAPAASSIIDMVSTTQGFLPPRMTTTQKNAIGSPASGLVVYDTTLNSLNVYNGSAWVAAGGGGVSYAADTGSANAYAIAPTPAAIAYTTGDTYSFKVGSSNTTSSTLNVSSLGTKNIKTPQVANLPANALIANAIAIVVYDGTQFQLIAQQDPTRVSPLTTKGDVHTYSTVDARQAVPGDYGYLVPDSGATTGWRSSTYTQLAGSPGKNYIQYSDFENNSATLGWTLTGCATLTNGLPTCVGSGGTAFSSSNGGRAKNGNTNAAALDSTSAVAGTYALNLATTGAGAIGDGYVSSLYTIDKADQAKVLSFKLYYKVASGTPVMGGTKTDTYAVAIYDPVNNAFLGTAGQFSFTQSTGVGIAQGTFQTASTTTSVQIFIYSPIAPTGTSSLLIDDVYIGPQSLAFGPAMTDPVAYTPTFTGLGTVASINFVSWRSGAYLIVEGTFTTGTATATEARISIGFNGADSSVTTVSTLPTLSLVGKINGGTASASYFGESSVLAEASKTYLTISNESSGSNGFAKQNGASAFSNATTYSLFAKVPVAGWSSNTVMSADTDTRVVAARMTGATATITGSYSDVTWTTIANDTHAAMGAISYTAPVTGYYDFVGAVDVGATSLSAAGGFFISLNTGSTLLENKFLFDLNVPENESLDFDYMSVYLTAGTAAKIQIKTSGTVGTPVINSSATTNFLAVRRQSGPAVVAASESVNMKYQNTAGTSITSSSVTVPFATKIYDTHNSFAAGVYTVPVAGKYKVTSVLNCQAVNNSTSQNFNLLAKVTSTPEGLSGNLTDLDYRWGEGVSHVRLVMGTKTYQMSAGDTIEIQANNSNTVSLNTTAGENWIAIERVGN